jgi:hypothetical protein
MAPRKVIRLVSWPDPLTQERIEDMGFFFDRQARLASRAALAAGGGTWVRFCDEDELEPVADWLRRHRLAFEAAAAKGRGELVRHPKLSDQLLRRDGGSPTACALCGARDVACRQWVEGDDTDSIDYPDPARFYLCGPCVQAHMQPHPRLYAPADDAL